MRHVAAAGFEKVLSPCAGANEKGVAPPTALRGCGCDAFVEVG